MPLEFADFYAKTHLRYLILKANWLELANKCYFANFRFYLALGKGIYWHKKTEVLCIVVSQCNQDCSHNTQNDWLILEFHPQLLNVPCVVK